MSAGSGDGGDHTEEGVGSYLSWCEGNGAGSGLYAHACSPGGWLNVAGPGGVGEPELQGEGLRVLSGEETV